MSALVEKDSNAQISPNRSQQSSDEQSMNDSYQGHKGPMSKISGIDNTSGTYISPSDAIMSPTTKKLTDRRQKQINNPSNTARRSLFARTLSNNSEKSEQKSLNGWK